MASHRGLIIENKKSQSQSQSHKVSEWDIVEFQKQINGAVTQ